MLLLFRRCFRRVYASRYTKRWTSHYSVGFSYKGEGEKRGVTFRAVTFLLCIFVFNQFAVTLRKYLGREILNTQYFVATFFWCESETIPKFFEPPKKVVIFLKVIFLSVKTHQS